MGLVLALDVQGVRQVNRLDEIQQRYDASRPGPDMAYADMGWLLAQVRQLKTLVWCLADRDPCWFDHHGGCQAHGYLDLQPGEVCPQQEAKDWLRTVGFTIDG